MFFGDLSEANTGTWTVVDMSANAMKIFLAHVYCGSIVMTGVNVEVFTEILNAANKVL
jgi:hypothetical protein